jgi:hypothetical protein
VWIFLAVVTAQACGGMSSQSGGSNTNWFATCSSSSDCDSGLQCWCGLCTKTCAGDCTANSAAACVKPPPSCAAPSEPAKEMACAAQCTRDADCSRVDARATCVESICRMPAGSSNRDSGAPLTCEDLTNRAAAAVQPILDAAERACRSDADCTDYSGISCTNHCSKAILAKSGLAAVQSQLDAVDQSICTRFHDQGCTVLEPPCTPSLSGCVKGTCQYTNGPTAPVDAGSSCDQLTNGAAAAEQALLASPDNACTKDDDCAMMAGPTCAACGLVASKLSPAAIQSGSRNIEQNYCKPFSDQGCQQPPPCFLPAGGPKCTSGRCEYAVLGAPSSCADRTTSLRAAAQSLADAADKTCAVDGDCEMVLLEIQCARSCTFGSISKAGGQALLSSLHDL